MAAIQELVSLLDNTRRQVPHARAELHERYADAAQFVLRRRDSRRTSRPQNAIDLTTRAIQLLEKLVTLDGTETRIAN